ncbi:MAG: uroporphyrinogen-III synthase [Ilumatobacter sp.]|nr:uroporphyrinogen-III synthase [Ilumatobacter sp.]
MTAPPDRHPDVGPLAGRRVLVTRERPGELGELLAARGAEVVHVPLIAIAEPDDGGAALRRELESLDRYDWLVVTSAAGAERVGRAAAREPGVRLAAVGTTTARTLAALAERVVDVTPPRQLAAELAAELIAAAGLPPARILVAQADRAAPTLVAALLDAGHAVEAVTAYRTVLQPPDRARIDGADALLLASGSAATSWVDAVGADGPPVIVAIGPATSAVARELGLKVTAVAADHSIEGLVDELVRQYPD